VVCIFINSVVLKRNGMKRKPTCLFIFTLIHFFVGAQTVSYNDIRRFEDSVIGNEYPDSSNLPGICLLVAEKGKPVYEKVSGMADVERGVKITNETVFEIGSISKQFAAVALLQLEEQGKLKLSDDIKKYIPWYNSHGETITVENLLTHTSGIRDFDAAMKPYYVSPIDRSVPEMIRFFMDSSLNFKPGTGWAYSNSNYTLVAYIVQLVSGMDYHGYVQTHIFTPLGMNHTCFGTNAQIIRNRAKGYTTGYDGNLANSGNIYCWAYGAGDIFSTTSDLLTWINALRDGKVISKAVLDKAWTSYHLPGGEPINYGYGFCINKWNNEQVVTHAGQMGGFICDYIYLPQKDVFIVAFTNTDDQKPEDAIVPLALQYLGQATPLQTKPIINHSLKKYEGVYAAIRKGAEYTSDFGREKEYNYIKAKNDHLSLQRSGRRAFDLVAIGVDSFTNRSHSALYVFKKSAMYTVGYFYFPLQYGPDIYSPKTNLPFPVPMKAVSIEPSPLKKISGKYLLESGGEVVFFLKSGQLFLQAGDVIPLMYAGNNVFFNTDTDVKITFSKSMKAIDSLVMKQGQITKGFRIQ
jgi:CubicO group peptidase (beta-lactamase class C family)